MVTGLSRAINLGMACIPHRKAAKPDDVVVAAQIKSIEFCTRSFFSKTK